MRLRILDFSNWSSSCKPEPVKPRTLIRAARDFAVERPRFALEAGITALLGMANGWGYDITGIDVLYAYAAVMVAAWSAGVGDASVKAAVRDLFSAILPREFITRLLKKQPPDE